MPKRNHPSDYEKCLLEALENLKNDPTLLITKAVGHRRVSLTTVRDRKNKGVQNLRAGHQHECFFSPVQENTLVS